MADGLCFVEVEGRALDGAEAAHGDHRGVGGRDLVAVDPKLVVEDGTVVFAAQIEIGVVGEVERRLLVRFGVVSDLEFAILEGVGDGDGKIAGVVFFAVGGEDGELQLVAVHFVRPDLLVEAHFAAVEVVAAVVAVKVVRRAVDGELALADAVAEAADERAQVPAVVFVPRHVVIAEDDVGGLAVLIGHDDALHDAAVVEDGGAARAVLEGEGKDFPAVRRFAEYLCLNHNRSLRSMILS